MFCVYMTDQSSCDRSDVASEVQNLFFGSLFKRTPLSFWYLVDHAGISLTLVYSSTNMSKSVWTSGFWKPLVHKNMSNFWNNIFHKLGLHFTHVRVLHTFSVWTSELWCGRVTFLNHSSTIRVPKNP